MSEQVAEKRKVRTGWSSKLAHISMALLLFEAISGLAITFSPFHAAVQWAVVAHTIVGVAMILPVAVYLAWHWRDYRTYAASHITVLGYVGLAALLLCAASGVFLTVQGFLAIRTAPWCRTAHLVTTIALLVATVPHMLFLSCEPGRKAAAQPSQACCYRLVGLNIVGIGLVGGLAWVYSGTSYQNVLPKDYSYLYGTNRPFAPSLARTDTGGAFDARSLAGSESCGTVGCHEQIVQEWKPSAHRYAAMDNDFPGDPKCHGEAKRARIDSLLRWLP
jgi:hypothetical protein